MDENIEIRDTLTAACSYLENLEFLNSKLQTAINQINTTTSNSANSIEDFFNKLLEKFAETLKQRKSLLLEKLKKVHSTSLTPLKACQKIITTKINQTEDLITTGNRLLENSKGDLFQFKENSLLLGSLPEIPDLFEVPFISFQYDKTIEQKLVDKCSKIGQIARIAPIQVCNFCEKPGAILVEWQPVDLEERNLEIEQFRLQKAFGDVLKHPQLVDNFADCYRGPDAQSLVKDLRVNETYSFRVCCMYEGFSEWTQWSQIRTFSTSISQFSWNENSDYSITNSSTIATTEKDPPSVLICSSPVFTTGHSVELTYLECGKHASTVGLIALQPNEQIESIRTIKCAKHHFVVDTNGDVVIDGLIKSTKLSPADKNLKLSFTCEATTVKDKLRIHIDCCDKRVTYEWTPASLRLYIAAQLSSQTKILIE